MFKLRINGHHGARGIHCYMLIWSPHPLKKWLVKSLFNQTVLIIVSYQYSTSNCRSYFSTLSVEGLLSSFSVEVYLSIELLSEVSRFANDCPSTQLGLDIFAQSNIVGTKSIRATGLFITSFDRISGPLTINGTRMSVSAKKNLHLFQRSSNLNNFRLLPYGCRLS